jgi:hypothetical protein
MDLAVKAEEEGEVRIQAWELLPQVMAALILVGVGVGEDL